MRGMRIGGVVLVVACASGDDGEDATAPHAFAPWDPPPATDPLTTRLCPASDDPHGQADTTFIDCAMEGGRFAGEVAPLDGPLSVMVWNLERGQQLDGQLDAWARGDLPVPDLLLASEVDRGCDRSGGVSVTGAIAETLGLDYAFGVEFVELPRASGSGGTLSTTCEHGNAILSRYPLGNVSWAIHADNLSWYVPPPDEGEPTGEPRLGGRSYVMADVDLGDGRYLRAVSVHFESRITAIDVQIGQAAESGALAGSSPIPAIVGGDTNAPTYTADVYEGRLTADTVQDRTIGAWYVEGLVDAHAELPARERGTSSGLIIDLLFGKDVGFSAPVVCDEAVCDPLSNHRAIWAEVEVPVTD